MSDATSVLVALLPGAEFEVLGERVYCDDELGLRWRRMASLPEEPVMIRNNARNETLLRAFAMLEEHDVTQADGAERAEFRRLEGKLDLTLELLADVVRDRQQAVPVCPVRFNVRGLCWDAPESVESGVLLAVECFLLPPWPLPLQLYVRVDSVDARDAVWRVCSRIEGTSPGVEDWLGKLVFRRHRRRVAQQRHRGGGSALDAG